MTQTSPYLYAARAAMVADMTELLYPIGEYDDDFCPTQDFVDDGLDGADERIGESWILCAHWEVLTEILRKVPEAMVVFREYALKAAAEDADGTP